MPMSGGFPAARRVRTSGMKSRAEVYSTLMPVLAVKAAVTFRNASFSLPPQSDSTSMEPALRFVGFALTAPAVNPAASTASATANVMNRLRPFNLILLLVAAVRHRRCLAARPSVRVQLEVFGRKADQQVAAAFLRSGFCANARELEGRASELERAVVGFRGCEVHGRRADERSDEDVDRVVVELGRAADLL